MDIHPAMYLATHGASPRTLAEWVTNMDSPAHDDPGIAGYRQNNNHQQKEASSNQKDDLVQWLKAAFLEESTIRVLFEHGLNNFEGLKVLRAEDIERLRLPLIQQRLLEKALGVRQVGTQVQAGITVPQLLGPTTGTDRAAPQSLGQSNYVMHLDRGGKTASHLDIVDFLPQSLEFQEESRLVMKEGSPEIILKGGPQKIKLEKVTVPQWNCANMAIMDKLILDGILSARGEREYRNYTYIINELAIRYQWVSVLVYDREYRALQARHGFPWGQPVGHLMKVFLKEKVWSLPQETAEKGNKTKRLSVELCHKYNAGTCTYNPCRFAHLCSMPGCNQKHSKKDHQPSTESSQPGKY